MVRTLNMKFHREGTSPQKRLGIARVVKVLHSFVCHLRVYPRMELTIFALAFPAKTAPHLLTHRNGRLSWLKHHRDE